MTVITTQRLILRPWDEVDAPALFPLASDPAVGPAAGWPAHASEEESLGVIRDVPDKTYDDNVRDQVIQVREKATINCVDDLLRSGDTWEVK